jgi:hypothetical protein
MVHDLVLRRGGHRLSYRQTLKHTFVTDLEEFSSYEEQMFRCDHDSTAATSSACGDAGGVCLRVASGAKPTCSGQPDADGEVPCQVACPELSDD